MDERTELLIRELADKFGTTSAHLWEVMVRQAPISSATNVLVFFVLLAALYLSAKVMVKKAAEDDYFEEFIVPAAIVWVFLSAFTILGFFFEFQMTVTGFLNPEYWALQQLLP